MDLLRRVLYVLCLLGLLSIGFHASEYGSSAAFAKDFGLDYVSGRAVLEGVNPYLSMRTLVIRYLHVSPAYASQHIVPGLPWHPPFRFIFIVPLAILPYRLAGVLWLLLSAASIVAAVTIVGAELRWDRRFGRLAGLATLALPIVQKDLSLGQINGELLFLFVLAWRSLRHRRDRSAGLALGLATALKIFPIFMLGYLLFRKRYEAAATGILAAAALTLTGVVATGVNALKGFLHGGAGFGLSYWQSAPTNVSWWGVATRWIARNSWAPNAGIDALGISLALGGIALITFEAYRGASGADPYWWGVLAMLVAWPIVWDHYMVLALPWLLFAGKRVVEIGSPLTTAAFAVVGFLMVLGVPPGAPPLTGPVSVAAQIGVYQLPAYAMITGLVLDAPTLQTPAVSPA